MSGSINFANAVLRFIDRGEAEPILQTELVKFDKLLSVLFTFGAFNTQQGAIYGEIML